MPGNLILYNLEVTQHCGACQVLPVPCIDADPVYLSGYHPVLINQMERAHIEPADIGFKRKLGDAVFDTLWAEGQAKPLAQSVAAATQLALA